jgi:hypothetical protein
MDEETRKKLQEVIDHDYELAKRHVKEMKEKYNIKSDLNDSFRYFVCCDLASLFDLDMKGATE